MNSNMMREKCTQENEGKVRKIKQAKERKRETPAVAAAAAAEENILKWLCCRVFKKTATVATIKH